MGGDKVHRVLLTAGHEIWTEVFSTHIIASECRA